jgi:hypothetical protein
MWTVDFLCYLAIQEFNVREEHHAIPVGTPEV